MSEVMRFVKGDHTNTIQWTCTDEEGAAINLTNVSTITVKIGRIGESTNLIEKAGTVTDATAGEAQFVFADGDLDTAGYFDAVIVLDYNTGAQKTLRNISVQILPEM
ncbi:MAG: BppU family phage baseplate upper protein [Candidatus Peribacteraceae bacterium]|nr:BppU family phage baseplate upper protein [Candidatus Peribacteraceae bacterium]